MEGRSVEDLRILQAVDIDREVGGLRAESKHAAVLCVDAVRQLLRAWQEDQNLQGASS